MPRGKSVPRTLSESDLVWRSWVTSHLNLKKTSYASELDVHGLNAVTELAYSAGDMTLEASSGDESRQARIMLGLLGSVERDGARSQRRLAGELGIALGLVNAYLKRCVKKGLVKASQAPARRYVYYLTPQGFAEKSRLTVEYLSSSFGFFRQAKEDCADLLAEARTRGFDSIALIGCSDLAEIAIICALESDVKIVAMIDPDAGARHSFFGLPIVRRVQDLKTRPAAIMVTDLRHPRESSLEAIAILGESRVFIPQLLRVKLRNLQEVAS